jgi:hypothetical protein
MDSQPELELEQLAQSGERTGWPYLGQQGRVQARRLGCHQGSPRRRRDRRAELPQFQGGIHRLGRGPDPMQVWSANLPGHVLLAFALLSAQAPHVGSQLR